MRKGFVRIGLILMIVLLGTGCSSNLEKITYNDLNEMIKEEKTFILEVSQNNCSHCEEFTPRFLSILDTYDIK